MIGVDSAVGRDMGLSAEGVVATAASLERKLGTAGPPTRLRLGDLSLTWVASATGGATWDATFSVSLAAFSVMPASTAGPVPVEPFVCWELVSAVCSGAVDNAGGIS